MLCHFAKYFGFQETLMHDFYMNIMTSVDH